MVISMLIHSHSFSYAIVQKIIYADFSATEIACFLKGHRISSPISLI